MLASGTHITVFDSAKNELGEGTLIRSQFHPDMGLTVYECKEHLILAKGIHWLKIGNELNKIDPKEGKK